MHTNLTTLSFYCYTLYAMRFLQGFSCLRGDSMRVKQRLNNNVVVVKNNTQDTIVVGSGVGFQVYPGDIVNKSKIEKTYILKEDINVDNFISIINNIPFSIIDMTHQIIVDAETILDKKMNGNLIVTLSDHLNFAISRANDAERIIHPLSWEIRQLYHAEHVAGLAALKVIEQTMGVVLPDDEASFIAMHFINAQLNTEKMFETIELTNLIFEIVKIVQYHFHITLDEQSFDFSRFITHIRYFLIRQSQEKQPRNEQAILFEIVKTKYVEEINCVEKIAAFLYKMYGWEMLDDEKLYLTLHVNRIIEKSK